MTTDTPRAGVSLPPTTDRDQQRPLAGAGSTVPSSPVATASARRQRLRALLEAADAPIAGDSLAERFGVSRQAIVQDVAVLRAAGSPIIATIRGYFCPPIAGRLAHRAVVAVRHGPDDAEAELLALVDLGIRVVDVVVEHQIYGELRAELHLSSPADVRSWADAARKSGAHLLSELTGGVHFHTIEAESDALLARGRAILAESGFLLGSC